jgi:hypothetical protein
VGAGLGDGVGAGAGAQAVKIIAIRQTIPMSVNILFVFIL